MKIRAAIFDIYGTLLEVSAPPKNADVLWEKLFENMLDTPAPFTRMEFSRRSSQVIALHHAEAKARGILWPEINWPGVVMEVIPALARLPAHECDEFILRQMQLGRTLRLADHAADCLRQLNEDGVLLGIASNSQAYTLREVDEALSSADLTLSMFDPDLCFWSFENGFSKPDPHVFRMLTARLEARGIKPAETLMVGDRLDNDIEPAQAQGFQTWLCGVAPSSAGQAGDWRKLAEWLRQNV